MKFKIEPLTREHFELAGHWSEKLKIGLLLAPESWETSIEPYAVVSDCGKLFSAEMSKADAENTIKQLEGFYNEPTK